MADFNEVDILGNTLKTDQSRGAAFMQSHLRYSVVHLRSTPRQFNIGPEYVQIQRRQCSDKSRPVEFSWARHRGLPLDSHIFSRPELLSRWTGG